jgi:autotransporter-associated beta strand protein
VSEINNGATGVQLSAPGILVLGGMDTYTGPTTVNAGTLVVEGSLTSSSVTVGASGTLGGGGSIGSTVDVSGTLAPGAANAPGNLTVNAATTLNANSTFALQLNGPAAGTDYDQLTLAPTASLSITSGANFALTLNYAPAGTETFTLIDNNTTSELNGAFANLADQSIFTANFAGTDYSFFVNYHGGDGNDLVLAVPEPTSAFTLLTGVALLGLRRVRRRKSA